MIEVLPVTPNNEKRPARYQGDLGEYLAEYYFRRMGFDVGRIGSKHDLLVQGPDSIFSVEVKSCTRPRKRNDGPDYYKFELSRDAHPDYYAFVALDKQLVVVEPTEEVTLTGKGSRYYRTDRFTEELMLKSHNWVAREHNL